MYGDCVSERWRQYLLKTVRKDSRGEWAEERGRRKREGILRTRGMPFFMVVLVWRLFGRSSQGSAYLDFSLSLRTGTLIRIGPGRYPRKGGALSGHYLKKRKKEGERGRRIAVAQQETLTANLIYMQVQGEWGELILFPISMLNAGQGSWWEWEALFARCWSFPLCTPIPALLS